jgi:hypothetical protein
MKFKKGDRVRITANKAQLESMNIFLYDLTDVVGKIAGEGSRKDVKGNSASWHVKCGTEHGGTWIIRGEYLELIQEEQTKPTNPKDAPIRTFDTGATRDTDQGKLDYTRALSSIVLERYVQYLNKHRKQPDGSMRDFDNWKKGLPFRESFGSLGRHFVDVWKMIEGFPAKDNHGSCNIDDTLCAIIFNASTMLLERLKGKQ